jgi:hypothetical protein
MAYDIKGTVKRVGALEKKSEKFQKRTLILEFEDGKFPQTVELQATGDRCALLDPLNSGDEISVSWNLRGREWTGKDGVIKVFNSCDIWKLEVTKHNANTTTPAGPTDDIPF